MDQITRYRRFAALHVPGEPLVLFNIWDAGSARAVAESGAKALATGSASVAGANGFGDGEATPLDLAIANLERIVAAVDLPVTLDFEGGYARDGDRLAANAALVKAAGAVGINFEDQIVGGEGIYCVEEQAARIAALRRAVADDFFINARTDIFLKSPAHEPAMIAAALERALAYADSGASGFFAPGLKDERLIESLVRGSPLPVNIMAFPGVPDRARLAVLGVARISHGPFPWRQTMAGLTASARAVMS